MEENFNNFVYKDPHFDVNNILNRNNIEELDDIEKYLEFAISETIKTQVKNISYEQECIFAKKILDLFMINDNQSFTRQYGIRSNMVTIGKNRIINLLIKKMIETYAYSAEVEHMLVPNDLVAKNAQSITEVIASGNLDRIIDWLNQQDTIKSMIDNYVGNHYSISPELKSNYYNCSRYNPLANKALEQFNLEIRLSGYRMHY